MRRGEQVGDALLPGDPADEDHDRTVRVDAEFGQHRLVVGGHGVPDLGVDAVVDHVHPAGVERRVGVQDVAAHAGAHRDDGVGRLVGVRSTQDEIR